MTALIYEQFNPLIHLYTQLLEPYGFEVFVTKDLGEAWEYFEANKVDIVVAKYEEIKAHDAPFCVELVKKIRGGTNRADTFIIVTAQDVHKPQEIELMKLGVFAILRLPITKGAFDSKIEEFLALGRHNSQSEATS